VGEDVPADVEEHDEIGAELPRSVRECAAHGGRPGIRVDEHGRTAEEPGHPRLGEREAAGPGGVRAGDGDGEVEGLGAGDLVEAARAGERVDRPALPGEASDDRFEAAGGVRPDGEGQGADDVAPATDADAQRAGGACDRIGDGGGGRQVERCD
jgi:hypothetical protein